MATAPAQSPATRRQIRSDPRVRRIVRDWRALTGGGTVPDADRATLVACSGGADSSALAIALASTPARMVLAHVVHDMRGERESLGDRDATRALARILGAEFVESRVRVRDMPGNLESKARDARYKALEALARDAGTPFVATGHHADDQLETVLMRLARGAGPRGLGGIAPWRPVGGVTLIRPMLGVERADARAICNAIGWAWREDATNADTGRARAAMRHEVIPALKQVAPGVADHAAACADACRDAAEAIAEIAAKLGRDAAVEAGPAAIAWERARLRQAPSAIIGELVRTAYATGTGRGDRLGRETLAAICGAILSASGEDRSFELSDARVRVTRDLVRLEFGDAATTR